MFRFERLPQVVQSEILRYALVAERVRQPPNKFLVEHYAFEASVLRLNSTISKEALQVMYTENAFVKVDWFFNQAPAALTNHEVPFFKLDRPLAHHIAEITIISDMARTHLQTKEAYTFLLVLEDMPKFTRLLRILDLSNFMGFHFSFKLCQPPLHSSKPALFEQEKMLLPFECVRGGAMVQQVSMIGPFDAALKTRVKQAMTQKVAWLRGGAWELHDLTLSIKRMGDVAWRLGNADMALAKYDDARQFDKQAWEQNAMMKNVDQKVHKALCRVCCTIWTDTALLMLTDMVVKETGERHYKAVPNMTAHIKIGIQSNEGGETVVPQTIIARFYNILGVAELGLGHHVKAEEAFTTSFRISPDPLANKGRQNAKEWRGLSVKVRGKRLKALLAALPSEPLTIPDMQEYSTPEVASEHWIMRELGYTGPIPYEDKIKPAIAVVQATEPHSNNRSEVPHTAHSGEVKPDVLRKHVEKYRKNINHPITKGKLIGWVALEASEIDGEKVPDENLKQASALENMFRSDCVVQ